MNRQNLSNIFDYRGGELYWKINPAKNVFVGDIAGSYRRSNIYKYVGYKGKYYATHVLIFLLFNGYRPPQVDHIDGNPRNNKIENLRAASCCQNQYNAKLSVRSSSGVKNVRWVEARKKWEVRVSANKRRIIVGFFEALELAELVAIEARDKYHGEFARHI